MGTTQLQSSRLVIHCFRSLRQQRAGRRRELHRGRPGHRARRAGRPRFVPLLAARPGQCPLPRSSTTSASICAWSRPGSQAASRRSCRPGARARDARRRRRDPAPLSEAVGRWMAEHPGPCAWRCAPASRPGGSARPPRRARRGRRAPAHHPRRHRRGAPHDAAASLVHGVRHRSIGASNHQPGLAILAVDDEPRARPTSSACWRPRPPSTASRPPRAQGGARLPLGRPLRRALPRRRDARDRGHGARAPAAPLRRPAGGRVPHRSPGRRRRGLRGPGARLPGQAGHARAARVGARARGEHVRGAEAATAAPPATVRGRRHWRPASSRSTTPRAGASGSCAWRRSRSPRPTATTRGSSARTGASCCARR